MARFYGEVGYAITSEKARGVYVDEVIEKKYYGDVTRHHYRWEHGEGVNDNFLINNEFSIVADPFAYENLGAIKYIRYMGTCWKVTSVEIQRPRLILVVGGVWNGEQASVSGSP